MSATWITIVALALITAAYKLAGPLLIGGRPLAPGPMKVLGLLAPALLSALLVAETFGHGRSLTLDARAAGLFTAGLLLSRRAPMIAIVIGAAAAAALVRLL